MEDVIDLASYRIDPPGRPGRRRLIDDCRAELHRNGLVNLPAFLRHEASAAAIDELAPVIDRHAFVHGRGTPNTFRGRDNALRVTAMRGPIPRMTAVFSCYERPGAITTPEERRGFHGRPA